jgi:protocatechuate 3,4-dioxygenase, alpha subunit
MSLQATTWQTVGPYFHIGLGRLFVSDLSTGRVRGRRITVSGRVVDGADAPIPDAVIEIWQANSDGKYAQPSDARDKPLDAHFRGYGRVPTDDAGFYEFSSIQPGRVQMPHGGEQAPHLLVGLMMRGLLKRLTTRVYFPDEPSNENDPILKLVPPQRRRTLLLEPLPNRSSSFRWNIHMQGRAETVFLEF